MADKSPFPDPARAHCLLVDDNAAMRGALRVMLAAMGVLRLSEAESGRAGLDHLKTERVDLVLTDWRMAPMDGLAFIRAVRALRDPIPRAVPILMVSGHASAEARAKALAAGADGYLCKPLTSAGLWEGLTLALSRRPPAIAPAEAEA